MRARDNPFRVERVLQVRYRPRGFTWPDLMDQLAKLNFRAAIVGPHGSGKTTLLEDIGTRLVAAGRSCRWLRLEGSDGGLGGAMATRYRFATAPAIGAGTGTGGEAGGAVVLIDGADSISAARWQWLRWQMRSAKGIIITSHRPGLLPTLIECTTDAPLLADIVDALREPSTVLPARFPHALYEKHRGNVRDALRELYDLQSA